MKNKKAIKIFSIILCLCLTAALFSGCGSKNKAIDFIYPFSADVKSYDPQVASTSDEFLIIENTFEGLIRMDDNGKITSGMADSWNVSDDGLTYTFTLKKGMKWNIDTETDDKGEFKDSRLKMLGRPRNHGKRFCFCTAQSGTAGNGMSPFLKHCVHQKRCQRSQRQNEFRQTRC